MTVELIDPAAWRSAPWGAAQGTSHEIKRWTKSSDEGSNGGSNDYVARVSVAEIERSGSFTALPGYQRWLAVLDDGGGLELAIDGRAWRGRTGDAISFDGCDPVHATITGPARVWNLIVRPHVAWSAAWHRVAGTMTLPGGVSVVHELATGRTRVATSTEPTELTVEPAPAIVVHLVLGS